MIISEIEPSFFAIKNLRIIEVFFKVFFPLLNFFFKKDPNKGSCMNIKAKITEIKDESDLIQ